MHSVFVWLVADDWCRFVQSEKYCWLIVGGWFVLREKYCCLVHKSNKQGGRGDRRHSSFFYQRITSAAQTWEVGTVAVGILFSRFFPPFVWTRSQHFLVHVLQRTAGSTAVL
jgi:hypothetical protein